MPGYKDTESCNTKQGHKDNATGKPIRKKPSKKRAKSMAPPLKKKKSKKRSKGK